MAVSVGCATAEDATDNRRLNGRYDVASESVNQPYRSVWFSGDGQFEGYLAECTAGCIERGTYNLSGNQLTIDAGSRHVASTIEAQGRPVPVQSAHILIRAASHINATPPNDSQVTEESDPEDSPCRVAPGTVGTAALHPSGDALLGGGAKGGDEEVALLHPGQCALLAGDDTMRGYASADGTSALLVGRLPPSQVVAQAVSGVAPLPRVLPVPVTGTGTAATSFECVEACQALIDYYKGVCGDAQCTASDKNNCPILRAKYMSHQTCARARNEYKFLCAAAMKFAPNQGHDSAIGREVDEANVCAQMFNSKPKCVERYGGLLTYESGLTPKGAKASDACGF